MSLNERMICQHIIITLLMTVFCLGTAGCFKQPDPPFPAPELFWPKPPEIRRIQFTGTVAEPEDLGIRAGMFKQFVNYIIGHPAASIVSPYGIATGVRGRLYVVDSFLKQVHVFDSQENRYFRFPEDKTLLAAPVGIAVDSGGLIYVTDAQRGAVYIFNEAGNELVGELGKNRFKRPTGIAVNPVASELLVVDTLQSSVFRYDLSTRKQKGSFGGNGAVNGRFHYPTHICVAPSGNIIVSDSLNFRVQIFNPEGRFLSRFGQMGHEPGTFSRPKGVACDSDGNIYVVDALFDNIQVFDPAGRLLMVFGNHGKEHGEFWLPTGMHIDQNDIIYVSDSSNQRIQMFRYLKEDIVK